MLYESPCPLVTIFFSHDHSLSAPAFVCNPLSYLLRLLNGIRIRLPRIIEHGHVTGLVVKYYHATVHEPVCCATSVPPLAPPSVALCFA
jgi:hypothetical protein